MLARISALYRRRGVLDRGGRACSLDRCCDAAESCWAGRSSNEHPGRTAADKREPDGSIFWPWIGEHYGPGGLCVVALNLNLDNAEPESDWWDMTVEYSISAHTGEYLGRGPGRQPAVELQPSRVSNGSERRRRAVLVGRPKPAARYRARPAGVSWVRGTYRARAVDQVLAARRSRGEADASHGAPMPSAYLSKKNWPCSGRVGCLSSAQSRAWRSRPVTRPPWRSTDVRVRDADLLSPAGRVLLDPAP